jgi:hypothetical protein
LSEQDDEMAGDLNDRELSRQQLEIDRKQLRFNRILAITAIFGLLIAAGQWWVSRHQTTAMTDSNKLAAESAQMELRAYLTPIINDRPLLTYSPESGDVRFEFRLKNCGKTPARKIVTRIKMAHLPTDQPSGINPESVKEVNGSGMTVGPDQEWTITTGMKLDDENKAFQSSGTYVAWVVGQMDYEDVFGKKWQTKFGFRQGLPHPEKDVPSLRKFDMNIIDIQAN